MINSPPPTPKSTLSWHCWVLTGDLKTRESKHASYRLVCPPPPLGSHRNREMSWMAPLYVSFLPRTGMPTDVCIMPCPHKHAPTSLHCGNGADSSGVEMGIA